MIDEEKKGMKEERPDPIPLAQNTGCVPGFGSKPL
jgi:hypothetical protein